MHKTNACRILDQHKVKYSLKEYPVDESDLSAITVAEKVGAAPGQVFKTLVMRGDKTGVLVACIPGPTEVDLKKAALASGNKKCLMVPLKELLDLTGYIRGGVSPVGMKKRYPFYLDQTALGFQEIFISAGIRGMQLIVSPADLLKITGGKTFDLIENL